MAEHEAGRATHHQPVPAPSPEAWIKTELARHPQRPYPMDFIEALFTDFSKIHGDRAFSDDAGFESDCAKIKAGEIFLRQ
jgi:acetyl-CoA carboxylase carboxyl transferase subunit alpha